MNTSQKFLPSSADASDKIERRRVAQPPPNMYVRERRYDYYEAHPEHRPRRLSSRRARWQQIRETL
jgi:hypothetical protein